MATPEKTQRTSTYVVLARTGDDLETWRQLHTVNGANAKDAIRNAVKEHAADDESVFIAVPMRSFKPMTRKVEQVTKEIWS